MRAVLAEGMRDWRGIYEDLVRDGQKKRVMRAGLDVPAAAAMIQDLWQGAMHRAQIERNVAPMRSAAQFLRAYLARPRK
jgi:hypothetical protein